MKIDWLVYTFIATSFISQEPQKLDGGEQIEVEEVDFEQLKDITKSEERFAKYSTIDKATTLDDLLNAQSLCNY